MDHQNEHTRPREARIHANAIPSFDYSTSHLCIQARTSPIQRPSQQHAICTMHKLYQPLHPSSPLSFTRFPISPPSTSPLPSFPQRSRDIEQGLQLLDERPLIITNISAIVFLERIDRLPRDERIQRVLFFQLPAVHRLVRAFDLDGHGRLALFADGNLFVVSFDGLAAGGSGQLRSIMGGFGLGGRKLGWRGKGRRLGRWWGRGGYVHST